MSTLQFTANLGFFTGIGKGGERDVTSEVTWSTSQPGLISIGAHTGLAAGSGASGSATVTARSGPFQMSVKVTISPATLNSISLTPVNPAVPLGRRVQFKATGNYSDSSQHNLSDVATWASAIPSVATVGILGLSNTHAQGTSTISASYGGVIGSSVLTVLPPVVDRIDVAPPRTTIVQGSGQQFKASAIYSDGSVSIITLTALWSSSIPSVATVTSGLASALRPGMTTIRAAQFGLSGAAELTVLPHPYFNLITRGAPWPTAHGMAAGLFDANSTIDLAVTQSGIPPTPINLLFGSGTGTFPVSSLLDLDAFYVAAGDFNNDGHTDLAFTIFPEIFCGTSLCEISILRGDGQGHFTPLAAYTIPDACMQSVNGLVFPISVADVNKDGLPDLIVGSSGFTVYLGTGNPANPFRASGNFGCGPDSGTATLLVADFNNDGNLDIGVVGAGKLTVWLGDGTGNFAPLPGPSGYFDPATAVADFDGDGKRDIATKSSPNSVDIYYGLGNGQFSVPTVITDPTMDPFGPGPDVLAAVDFNQDGHPDLIFSGRYPDPTTFFTILSAYVSRSNRTFVPAGYVGCSSPSCYGGGMNGGAYAIVVTDINGDGVPDVVIAGSNSLTELLSTNFAP